VSVVVSFPDRDERDSRVEELEKLAEAVVRGAVVRNLQKLDLGRMERQGHGRLRIAGEERVELAVARKQDDAVLMRILPGEPRPVGPKNPKPEGAELKQLPDPRRHDSHAAAASLTLERPFLRAVRRLERIEDEADGERVHDVRAPADVVPMRVGDDERREPPEAEGVELRYDSRFRRTFVDQDRAAATR
jgi:hypothetical protein